MNLPTHCDPQWHDLQVIARGANRICTLDPDDSTRCLKYELPLAERTQVGMRQRLLRGLARIFPYLGENRTELRAFEALHARLGAATEGRIARCHGMVATPAGLALSCECVLLGDATPARSLYHYLFMETPHSATDLCAAVDDFEYWLLQHDVPLFDLNAGNFVVVGTGQPIALICIDAKSILGNKELVPFSRWSRALMHRKIRRRAQRLRQRIRNALETRSDAGAPLAGRTPAH